MIAIIPIPQIASTQQKMNELKQDDLFDYYKLEQKDRSFWQYHQDNPHIYELFKQYAFQLIDKNRTNFGAKGIIERIRWETHIADGCEPLKINNNYAPGYARLFMVDHPEHKGFFRIRGLKAKRNQ